MERPPERSDGSSGIVVGTLRVSVLGGFQIDAGDGLSLSAPPASQRLLAFLTFQREFTTRHLTATSLWPDASERHAAGNLRSALSRLSAPCRQALAISGSCLAIAETTVVDVWTARGLAHRLMVGGDALRDTDLVSESVDVLSTELLPGWYDDWALVAAEDWRQLRLHALEALVELLITKRRFGDAVAAALAAVRADPLRESPHGALIRVHLAEGNQTEALAQYRRYENLLQAELRLSPTPRLRQLVEHLQQQPTPGAAVRSVARHPDRRTR
jgi:DNA-binding SARP family transcriptional activator